MWATVNYALIIIVLVILLIGWIVYGIKTKIMCQQEDGPGEQNQEMQDMSPTYTSIDETAVLANGGQPRLHHIDEAQNAQGGSSGGCNGHVEEPREMGSSELEGLLSDSGAVAISQSGQSAFDETENIPEGNSGGEYRPVQEHTHMLSPENMDLADSGGAEAISTREAQNKGTEPQNEEANDPDYVLRPGVSK